MRAFTQLWLLGRLLVLSAFRGRGPGGRPVFSPVNAGRTTVRVLLPFAWFFYSLRAPPSDEARPVFVQVFAWLFLWFAPTLTVAQPNVRFALLQTSPWRFPARIAIAGLNPMLVICLVLPPFLSPERWAHPPLALVGFAALFGLTSFALTAALFVLLSVAVGPSQLRGASLALAIGGAFVLLAAGVVQGAKLRVPLLWDIGGALIPDSGVSMSRAVTLLLLLLVASITVFAVAERRGYDRPTPAVKPPGAKGSLGNVRGSLRTARFKLARLGLNLEKAEQLMIWRRDPLLFLAPWLVMLVSWFVASNASPENGAAAAMRAQGALCFVVICFMFVATVSSIQFTLEEGARAFTASLPLPAGALLESRTATARRILFPLLLACVPWLFIEPGRTVALGAGLALVAFAVPGVVLAQGGERDVALLLASLPLGAAVLAPSLWLAIPPLAVLALLAVESRRAAARRLLWHYEGAGETTEVWRALLAIASFAAVQGIGQVALGTTRLSPMVQVTVSYAAAGLAALIALKLDPQPHRLRLRSSRLIALPLGPLLGLAGGQFAVRYVELFERWHVPPPEGLPPPENALDYVLRAGIATIAAPIVEEVLFRGRLQPAFSAELPPKYKPFAFAVTALVFAGAHPPLAFPPVFLMGLVAGGLTAWSGGLLPAMLAHATYNAWLLHQR